MKLLLIATLCAILTASEPVAAQTNSTINVGDFETGLSGFNLNLGQEFPGAKGTLTRDVTIAEEGRASARLQADFGGGGVYVAMGKSLPEPIALGEIRFWVKSLDAKSLRLRLIDGTGQVHQFFVAFQPDGQWHQVQVTEFNRGDSYMHWGGANDGQWHQPAKAIDLILEKGNLTGKTQGTVWIDDVQAIGTQLQPLSIKLSQKKLGNIFLTDEPVQFGVTSTTTVHWVARDFAEQNVAEGTSDGANGPVVITVPMQQPGYYTLHLTANQTGAVPAAVDTSFAMVTPFNLSAVTDSPFGVMTHFAQGWDPDMAPLIALAGAAHNRDELYWDNVEPKPGEYTFPESYERYMGQLRHSHVAPLVPLTFANKNYDDGQTPYTEAGLDAYAHYAQKVLAHYGSQISAVEIWNEYNGSFCQGPACQDRSDTYTKMLQRAYTAVKKVRPDVTVLGCSTAGVPLPFLEKVFQHGGLKYMDAVSIHPYRYSAAPEGIEIEIERLQSLIKKYNDGKPKPIWVTEVGWFLKPSEEPGDLAITAADQAKFLVRGYTLLLSAGVQQVYWYLFRDYAEFATMGLVHSDTSPAGRYTPKPAYVAFATMTRQLNALRFARREPTAPGIYSLLFQRSDQGVPRDIRVLWSLTPQTLEVNSKTPITVLDMMGASRTLQPARGKVRLALSDAPQYLTGDGVTLPPAPPTPSAGPILADSELGFSDTQGKNGWYYGYYEVHGHPPAPADFKPLPRYRVTDWREEWVGDTQWLSVTSTQQHPGAANGHPVWSVRRWVSTVAGHVRLAGALSRGTKGDGVNVHILVDGHEVFVRQLGGGQPLKAQFDLVVPVHVGSNVDFAVDSGPGTNTDYDETQISATIFQIAAPAGNAGG